MRTRVRFPPPPPKLLIESSGWAREISWAPDGRHADRQPPRNRPRVERARSLRLRDRGATRLARLPGAPALGQALLRALRTLRGLGVPTASSPDSRMRPTRMPPRAKSQPR